MKTYSGKIYLHSQTTHLYSWPTLPWPTLPWHTQLKLRVWESMRQHAEELGLLEWVESCLKVCVVQCVYLRRLRFFFLLWCHHSTSKLEQKEVCMHSFFFFEGVSYVANLPMQWCPCTHMHTRMHKHNTHAHTCTHWHSLNIVNIWYQGPGYPLKHIYKASGQKWHHCGLQLGSSNTQARPGSVVSMKW